MKCYSSENIERIFYSLKKQGKIDLQTIDTLRPVNQLLKDLRKKLNVVKRRLKKLNGCRRSLKKLLLDYENSNQPADSKQYIYLKRKLLQADRLIVPLRERRELVKEEIGEAENLWNETIKSFLDSVLHRIIKGSAVLKLKYESKEEDNLLVSADSVECSLICQLIKEDIKQKYKVMPADRNEIISQIKALLDNNSPKTVIRADIVSFFKSIPFEGVIEKLIADDYLETISLRYLKRIRRMMKSACHAYTGVPMGLAFSSYLAEIYMQNVDREIRNITGVSFYRRYVDDIFILAYPVSWPEHYWHTLGEAVGGLGLKLHEDGDKRKVLLINGKDRQEFSYLGYRFLLSSKGLKLLISKNRVERYRQLVDAIFREYAKNAGKRHVLNRHPKSKMSLPNGPHPLRRLFSDLCCLTGNGNLTGDKHNVSVGVYYSNRHVTDISDFKRLDKYLREKIESSFCPPDNQFCYGDGVSRELHISKIKEVLLKWTFVSGFEERRFCKNPKFTDSICNLKRLK